MVLKDFGVVLAGPWLGFGWALLALAWLGCLWLVFGWFLVALAAFEWPWLGFAWLRWAFMA